MSVIEMRPSPLTPEFCEAVIERYVKPVFEANRAEGLHTRREGSLLILADPYPGAVYGDIRPYATDINVPEVVTSYNDVWWRHDNLYARAAFAGLEANLTPEIAL